MNRSHHVARLMRTLRVVSSAGLVCMALPAAAQDTKHFKPGEAPSADEVARILGGCESADNCDGVRTRQIMVRKKGQAAPPSGFSVPVQFELGSANLTPAALSSLAGIAAGLDKVLQANPQARIAIEGHADRSGEEMLNKDLSARRAMAVRDYLSSRIQVPAESLQVQGFGSSRPIPGTDPYAGANRRVEFRRVQ
jgi:OOP family OmpA-OmpF porin